MYAPDPPDRRIQRMIRCQPADIEETQKARDLVRAVPARGNLSYLDRLIHKPWGSEFRVYEDDVREAWCLHLRPHRRTSLHCHPSKLTALLCLQGSGTLSTCAGMHHVLEPGVVFQIEPGAYHRSTSSKTGLRLVEIETPKDKFDLLRLADDFRDVTAPYEGEEHAPLRLLDHDRSGALPPALQPLVDQPLDADRWARLRAHRSIGGFRFAVESGERVRTSRELEFAIALERHAAPLDEVTVLGPERASAAEPHTSYLTIRPG
ncbi:MAG: cupin domain-containing protein [Solirubrobacteraceae bacterium]